MKRIKDKTHSIKFSKKILDKLNPSKPTRYYDILTQGLGIYGGRKKSYFLQASIPTIKSNGKILKDKVFENIWIQPAAGDAGGSLGAALAYWYKELKKPRIIHKNEIRV